MRFTGMLVSIKLICIYVPAFYAYTYLPSMHIRFTLYAYIIYRICIYHLPYMHIRFTVYEYMISRVQMSLFPFNPDW